MSGLTSLIMGIVNGFEWVFIVLIIVVLFFGAKKIPELARSFGKATTEFEKAKIEARKEIQEAKIQDTKVGREKLEAIADTLGIDYTNKNDEELRMAIETEINNTRNRG
jgi:sec-independent protein translocase protein TatA